METRPAPHEQKEPPFMGRDGEVSNTIPRGNSQPNEEQSSAARSLMELRPDSGGQPSRSGRLRVISALVMAGGGVLRRGWCAQWPRTLLLFLFSLGAFVQVGRDSCTYILFSHICVWACLVLYCMTKVLVHFSL